MEFEGKIIAVLEKRGGTSAKGNVWSCQEYVIENHDQYPKKMCFEVFSDEKINQFNIQPGEELKVHFDVDAREWNGRWFNSLRAWRVERMPAAGTVPGEAANAEFPSAPAGMPQVSAASDEVAPESDELPF